MSDDDEIHEELIRRLFYLVTIAAEDAATLATEGQSPHLGADQATNVAGRLRSLGEQIEILATAIAQLCLEAG